MTRRTLIWITATAVVLGVVGGVPTPAGAADPLWIVTIDAPAEGAVTRTQTLVVEGSVAYPVVTPESVTVTAVPTVALPASCGEPATATGPVTDGRYLVVLKVLCNGPYRLEFVARNAAGDDSGAPETRNIAVEEAPMAPAKAPDLDPRPDGRVAAYWPASADPGAAGWLIVVDVVELPLPAETLWYLLPVEYTHRPIAMRAVRWGAEGPGGPTVVSPVSNWVVWGEYRPPGEPPKNETPEPPVTEPPVTEPPVTEPPPTSVPSTTTGPGPDVPSRATGSGAPQPQGYTEELPFAPKDGIVPGQAPRRAAASSEGIETASATSPAAGFVRTSERGSPGLVAPFAIGLMMLTVAAHIAWYLRRTRPQGPGQASLG